ncbi:MAG: hypothetical protein LBS84_12610 [Clostridiales bacterium]|nr:hypothetical protein [Clostridiales bacterium]
MFRSNIPIKIWGIFVGVVLFTVLLCIIIAYRIGLSNAVVTVGGNNYKPSEAVELIIEYAGNSERLEADLESLQTKFDSLDSNYTSLVEDFDRLNADYEIASEENLALKAELNNLRGENTELDTVSNNLRMQNLDLSKQLEELSGELEKLRNDNSKSSALVDDLRRRLENMLRNMFT